MESQPALHLPGANDHYVEGSIFCGDFCCSFFLLALPFAFASAAFASVLALASALAFAFDF